MRTAVITTIAGMMLLSGCGTNSSGPGEAIGFTAAAVVSLATANGAAPMFTVTSNGARVLSWVADGGGEAGGTGALHFQVGAGSGEIASVLTDPLGGIEPHGEGPPQIAAGPDGSLHALYVVGKDVGARFPKSALRYARSLDQGRTWSEPVSINEGELFGSHNFHALLAGPDGSVYASWLSSNGNDDSSGVWLRASRDGGMTWEPSHPIYSGPTCPCCRTALALTSDGTLLAAWRKIFDDNVRDIVVMTSRDGGMSWTEPGKPRDDGWSFPGCPHAGPSMKVDASGVAHIAWWTGKVGEAGVHYARSTDGGGTWTSQPIDIGERSSPAHVQLAVSPSGSVVVAWDDGKSATPGVLIRESTDGGVTFAAPVRLSEPGVAAIFPVLAMQHDSLTVAWTQVADSAYRAALAARPDMRDPAARLPLPRVGQQEIWARSASRKRE